VNHGSVARVFARRQRANDPIKDYLKRSVSPKVSTSNCATASLMRQFESRDGQIAL
jgi:hypothetical protein